LHKLHFHPFQFKANIFIANIFEDSYYLFTIKNSTDKQPLTALYEEKAFLV